MTDYTPGPWFVRDFSAITMKALGWECPSIDRILITNKDGPEIEACDGADCVVARIQFDNRSEALTETNIADAELIASAPRTKEERDELLEAIKFWVKFPSNIKARKNCEAAIAKVEK